MIELAIHTEFIKLKDALKFGGMAESGAQAKRFVEAGDVWVNGAVCKMAGKKLRAGDTFTWNGQTVRIVL